MRRATGFAFLSLLMLSACGGSGGSQIIDNNPILSLDEAGMIVIDQFYVNGGLEDEYTTRGEFSVYISDAATGKNIACASAESGMKWQSAAGIYYGGLSVPLRPVDDSPPDAAARFKVIFVEKDSEDCPAGIDRDDDIVGESAELTFEKLLGKRIWAENGRAAVLLRAAYDEPYTVEAMEPALSDGLSIDKLYFEEGAGDDTESRYYIFAEEVEGDTTVADCQIPDTDMEKIRHGGIIYSALGFQIPCPALSDENFDSKKVRVGLYVQRENGPELIGETEAKKAGELIGEKVAFTNGGGYVSFHAVMPEPFSAAVVRLSELSLITIHSLEYVMFAPPNSNVELYVIEPESGYAVACAGTDQGLSGINSTGNFSSLSARLVAVDGQKELFGFDKIRVELVSREDGLSCPSPLIAGYRLLGATGDIASTAFTAGALSFQDGAGQLSFNLSQ